MGGADSGQAEPGRKSAECGRTDSEMSMRYSSGEAKNSEEWVSLESGKEHWHYKYGSLSM